jgi:hypothetical protein
MFLAKQSNGEVLQRDWIIYSPSNGSIYCFICTLATSEKDSFSCANGFSDWKNGREKLDNHEKSEFHRASVLKMCCRRSAMKRVDFGFEKQVHERKQYWCEILRRVVAVVTLLAERGLALRGENEIIG